MSDPVLSVFGRAVAHLHSSENATDPGLPLPILDIQLSRCDGFPGLAGLHTSGENLVQASREQPTTHGVKERPRVWEFHSPVSATREPLWQDLYVSGPQSSVSKVEA